jgi:erythromycin esterase-like protein
MASRAHDAAARLQHARTLTADDLSATLRRHIEPLPALRHRADFGARFDNFGSATVVLLGEATHGTSEFYDARAAITRRLVEEHGFSIVAVEADWPDAARVDAYVRHLAPRPDPAAAFERFPQWMWRNAQFAAFADWLRAHNRDLPEEDRVSFRGLDVYSLNTSISAVLDYLDRRDPAQAAKARERYGCLTPWQQDPAHYGLQAAMGADTCEAAVVSQMQSLLERRLAYMKDDGEAFFDAAQNARVVRSAEQYYRAMYRSSAESWNLRDRHMFESLQALLKERQRRHVERGGRAAKAVVWAHNSHIGNAAATAMGWQGEFNIGELCRNAYGDDAVLIGFATDRGTVAAASDWGGEMEIKSVRPARSDSYEHAFRGAGQPCALAQWRAGNGELAEALSASLLERAIGVIYRPETELQSHYFESVMSEQFDAWVWFEETSAVTALPSGHATGMPDTYPFGI